MKPRTKKEKEIVKLSHTLKPHKRQLNRAVKNLTKEGAGSYYHVIAEVISDYQVFRFFRIHIYKRKQASVWETQQLWYKDGREALISRQRTMGCYYDVYSLSSELELRRNYINYAYNSANGMPYYTIDFLSLTEGFDKEVLENTYSLKEASQIYKAVTQYTPYFETLYKQQKWLFIKLWSLKGKNMEDYFPEVKVALRHKYLTKDTDISLWIDCIKMARELGLDTHNPFYICPKYLDVFHDQLLRKIEKKHIKERIEALKGQLPQFEEQYAKHIKPFLELMFQRNGITITPITTVKDMCREGEMMHHCVFAMGYYKKDTSLILSAQVDGKHVETIEINLKDFTIVQSRGKFNKPTEYHDDIVSILNENMKQIREMKRTKRNKRKKAA